jgi:hypothetical protein
MTGPKAENDWEEVVEDYLNILLPHSAKVTKKTVGFLSHDDDVVPVYVSMWSTECIRESARLNGPYANLFLVRTRF